MLITSPLRRCAFSGGPSVSDNSKRRNIKVLHADGLEQFPLGEAQQTSCEREAQGNTTGAEHFLRLSQPGVPGMAYTLRFDSCYCRLLVSKQ
jgi:hypothetical protein